MADLWHQFGADLTVGPTGDIATTSGSDVTQQRVLRRLLTNPGDYIWQPDYGAGLGQFVGQPAATQRILGVIRGQIFNEASVARSPEPVVDISATFGGVVTTQIRYSDSSSDATQLLSFSVGGT